MLPNSVIWLDFSSQTTYSKANGDFLLLLLWVIYHIKEFGLTVALSVSCKLAVAKSCQKLPKVAKRLCVIKSYSDILTRYANYSLAVFLFVDRKVNFWLLWYWSSIEEYSYISSASHNNVLYHSHCAQNYAKRQMRFESFDRDLGFNEGWDLGPEARI